MTFTNKKIINLCLFDHEKRRFATDFEGFKVDRLKVQSLIKIDLTTARILLSSV